MEGFNGPEPGARSRWTTEAGAVPGRVLAAFKGAVAVEVELGMLTRCPLPVGAVDAAVIVPGRTGTDG